jgi:hypothetical protein
MINIDILNEIKLKDCKNNNNKDKKFNNEKKQKKIIS